MGFITSVKRQFRPSVAEDDVTVARRPVEGDQEMGLDIDNTGTDNQKGALERVATAEVGVATIEAAQAIWGKRGRYILIAGLVMIMIIYEIDNSTVYIYGNYSTSSFDALSLIATLGTANTVIFAVVKPPLAKISNVIGRGHTYMLTISCYILAYILMASASTVNIYAAGSVFHTIGQSGTNIMNDIIISDITTARWRAFAIGVSFTPFLITTWVSAFIVDSVVADGGIGWRWGIGMFAIIMPFGASFIITTLVYYQSKAKKMGLAPKTRITLQDFCSQIDLGGIILFSGGLALLLLPMALSGLTPSQWGTPWVIAFIILGAVLLLILPYYEHRIAQFPILPPHYFKNITIVMCLLLLALDSLAFACTHSYLYAWGSIAHNFSARDATFYIYTNGAVQTLVAILAGLVVAKVAEYKYIAVAGAVIRTVGYGVMLQLRGADNSTAELFVVQVVQGIGSGILGTTLLVPAQISVPHSQMAQITALVVCFAFVGSSVGACIAGGIYTNTFKPALWAHLGEGASAELVESFFNSITGVIPAWGTAERDAINAAYSDVVRYMTYAALGASIPGPFLALLLPNYSLPDRNNLVET